MFYANIDNIVKIYKNDYDNVFKTYIVCITSFSCNIIIYSIDVMRYYNCVNNLVELFNFLLSIYNFKVVSLLFQKNN